MLSTITQNKKHTKPLFILFLSLLTLFTFMGCKSPEATEITSEPVSEVVSEEVSEVVSEEPSEEVSEEVVEGIEYTNFSDSNEMKEYLQKLNRTTIVECNFSDETGTNTQAIIPNGEKYTMQMGNILHIYPCKEVVDIETNIEYISLYPPFTGYINWGIYIDVPGTDMEVSFTVIYADGTEEDFTIYATIEE